MPRGCWVRQRTQKKGQEAERGHEIWSPSCLGILCLGPAVPPLSSGPLASAITSFLLLLCQLGFLPRRRRAGRGSGLRASAYLERTLCFFWRVALGPLVPLPPQR